MSGVFDRLSKSIFDDDIKRKEKTLTLISSTIICLVVSWIWLSLNKDCSRIIQSGIIKVESELLNDDSLFNFVTPLNSIMPLGSIYNSTNGAVKCSLTVSMGNPSVSCYFNQIPFRRCQIINVNGFWNRFSQYKKGYDSIRIDLVGPSSLDFGGQTDIGSGTMVVNYLNLNEVTSSYILGISGDSDCWSQLPQITLISRKGNLFLDNVKGDVISEQFVTICEGGLSVASKSFGFTSFIYGVISLLLKIIN